MSHVNSLSSILTLPLATLLLTPTTTNGQRTETESQRQMARQMAEWMDTVWNQRPDSGMANIRLLLKQTGNPFAGKISIHTEFSFRAVGRRTSTQGFNPNANGRWVFEGLEPGDYELQVVGAERFAGFRWSQLVTVRAGDRPVFEIDIPG